MSAPLFVRFAIAFFLLFLFVIPTGVLSAVLQDEKVLTRFEESFLALKTPEIPPLGKMVIANLDRMELTLYENGASVATIPILSKGRKGTPWETPGGIYAVLLKEKNHFSSLGHVYMPWSMQFYGNFFIHGWPYDEAGNDVPRGYSGGCIRLSTFDAERVYAFVEKGTPIVIESYSKRELSGGYYLKNDNLPPEVSAESFLVTDLERSQVLWKKNIERPISGLLSSKFLSALASLENMNQYTPRRLPSSKAAPWFSARVELPAQDLIAPLLYSSHAQVEEFLAREHGKGHFVRAMAEKSRALGMHGTSIIDVGGPETKNETTLEDSTLLLRGLDQSKPYLLELTTVPLLSFPDEEGLEPVVIENVHTLPSGALSSIGGLVDLVHGDGLLLVRFPVEGGGERKIAIAISQSPDIAHDTRVIMEYLLASLEYLPESELKIIEQVPTSFFAKLRTVWNRLRVRDILLGVREEHKERYTFSVVV